MCSALRIEWAKARARRDRWKEEVLILREEMRRYDATMLYHIFKWNGLKNSRNDLPHGLKEGIHAYACRQSLIHSMRRNHAIGLWSGHYQPETMPIPSTTSLTMFPINVAQQDVNDEVDEFIGSESDESS
jgi:hypothetical protein